jgi:hypothetical protein
VLAAKTFIGERLDLEHYAGIPIQGFELEVLDSNDDPFDFTDYDTFTLEIFAKAHGRSIEAIALDVPAANVITIDHSSPTFLALRPTLYFVEVYCYTTASPALKTLISYGILDLPRQP